MTGPSSSPRGEHAPRPGATWEQHLIRTEQVIDDPDDTSVHGLNDPLPPRPNRATRRAMQRATRRKK
ncbi:hypothetical protein OG342_05020 [Streptomyces bobili]|uniref:hypothetical protein n=1 Tax=Streptomyces bobili TaxID=67280 RepID=UPI00225AEB42|nr:hypothetical protein [Streptomyces bobili]MCX5522229.1 hypothetical protein [Streptomyces bobili]